MSPETLEAEKTQTATPKEKVEEEKKEAKPTLEELNEKLNKVLKQNSDKDSYISKLEGENAKERAEKSELQETLQKVSASIVGKPKEEQDAEFEQVVSEFVNDGFDEKATRKLLKTSVAIARKEANKSLAPIIMDYAQGLVESDTDIDEEFLKRNEKAITIEFNSYKPEVSPRKIKANLKKAYQLVKDRLVEEAKKDKEPEEKSKREEMLPGGSVAPKGKKEEPKDDFLDRIDKAGSGKNSHFI